MKPCLIVTASASEFATPLSRIAEPAIPVRTCTSADEARRKYDGEEILLGNPGMIAEVIAELAAVKWVQSTWAGVTPLIDHARRDYILTGVKGIFGPQMSEYVLGYLLAHELKVVERKQAQRDGVWFAEHSGTLAGKRLGIMGTGSIGNHIANTARAFGMSVTGLSRSGRAIEEIDTVRTTGQVEEFLCECDVLVSTRPQTPETENLLNSHTLSSLPDGAYFVNVGRSNVVDDRALIEALESGKLAGAALDVFDEEPVPAESPLWDAPNLSITAHIAAISHPSLIVPIFVDNYRRFITGKPLQYVVDFSAGY
jgi:phosphoglycerate dehydrogenase-like enzyme